MPTDAAMGSPPASEPARDASSGGRSRRARAAQLLTLGAVLLGGADDATAAAPKRVAILYFDNNTKDPDLDLLRKGMADMLITDLSGLDRITVVERDKLEALLAELKLQRSKFFDPKTAVKLGRGAGATHAVTGAFNAVGDELRIDVRLIEVGTSNVVATEKVLGAKADFFDLEQRLAAGFACALAKQRCGAKVVSGGPGLELVRRYAQGLDLADAGDLKAASKTLQSVVTAAPRFAPAKATYRRIMKRMYAARATRTDKLSEVRDRLDRRIAAALEGDRLAKAGPDDADRAGRWAGYRVLAGQVILHRIDAHFREVARVKGDLTKPAVVRFQALAKSYFEHQRRLADDLDAFAKRNPDAGLPDCEIADEDTELGKKLGLGDEPGVLSFYSTIQIRRDLARFITTGAAPFWGTFRFSKDIPLYPKHRIDSGVRVAGVIEYRVVPRPPVDRLHAELGDEAVRLFEAALAASETLTDAEDRQKEVIATLEAFADGLVGLQRPEEAIARWQTILDRFPKYEEYDRVEAKIRAALGD